MADRARRSVPRPSSYKKFSEIGTKETDITEQSYISEQDSERSSPEHSRLSEQANESRESIDTTTGEDNAENVEYQDTRKAKSSTKQHQQDKAQHAPHATGKQAHDLNTATQACQVVKAKTPKHVTHAKHVKQASTVKQTSAEQSNHSTSINTDEEITFTSPSRKVVTRQNSMLRDPEAKIKVTQLVNNYLQATEIQKETHKMKWTS